MYLVINKCVTAVKVSDFFGHYLRNRSTLDIDALPTTFPQSVLPIAAYQQDTGTLIESDGTICCLCTTICPPEDEYLILETCRGE